MATRCASFPSLSSYVSCFARVRSLTRERGWTQFECVQKLAGHSGEVWALAVSHKATFVVSGSHDKSIRIWEKTDEPVRCLDLLLTATIRH